MPYYATYTGHIQNGIFTTWEDCKKEIHKKPKYKKFKTYAEAEEYHEYNQADAWVGDTTPMFIIK